jgi:hypothetical protein
VRPGSRAVAGATNCSLAAKPLSTEGDPELARAYDELCAQTYTGLRAAVCALREGSNLPMPASGIQ